MTRTSRAAIVAAVIAVGLPASAHAARISGTVIAKDQVRGAFVVAGQAGVATTVRAPRAHPRLGDRLVVNGPRLAGGMVRARSLRVVGHVRRATLRAVVVRELARQTLVSAGGSILSIRHAATRVRSLSLVSHHRAGLTAGSVASFGLSISSSGVTQTTATALGVTPNVQIEGRLVSLSPLVVSIKGLPITITVPGGVTVPAGLQPGDAVQLTVSVDANNAFTLVSFDDQSAGAQQGAGDDNQGAGDDNQGAGDDDQGDNNDDQAEDSSQGSSGSGSSPSASTGGEDGSSGAGGDRGGSGGGDD